MKYIKDTLQHTDQVMQTYHVNSLLAKVIESKNMGLSEYEKFVSPHLIYHDFSLFSEADLALERIQHQFLFRLLRNWGLRLVFISQIVLRMAMA